MPGPAPIARESLHKLWVRTGGKAWEPPNPRDPMVERLVASGYVRRCRMRFLFEAMGEVGLAWTDAGRAVMEGMDAVAALAPLPAPETVEVA